MCTDRRRLGASLELQELMRLVSTASLSILKNCRAGCQSTASRAILTCGSCTSLQIRIGMSKLHQIKARLMVGLFSNATLPVFPRKAPSTRGKLLMEVFFNYRQVWTSRLIRLTLPSRSCCQKMFNLLITRRRFPFYCLLR